MSTYKPINKQSPFCMLFHTNFENPMISLKHETMVKLQEEKDEPKPKPKNTLKFTVRSILPNKSKDKIVPESSQEDEVRLVDTEKSSIKEFKTEHEERQDQKLERRRQKRRMYKQKRNRKLKEIRERKKSLGEKALIELLGYIDDNNNIEFDISHDEYSNRLNMMTKLYNGFMDDEDILEL
jgi:molecular chaperone GrpE (heat shock protein)